MNDQKTYNKMMARLDAIAETIPEKQAERAAAAIRKAEIYNEAFWDTMHTGMPHNALKEGSDGSGGYLVPDTYEDKLVKALASKNVLRQIGHIIKTTHRAHIPVAGDVDAADWVPENTVMKFMDAEFGEVILDAYKLATSIRATDEMLKDGGVDLEKFILNMFSERIGKAEEEAFIRGDGSGKPLGLIHQASVGAVSEGTGDISLDDMLELEYSVESAYRKNAVWVMSERMRTIAFAESTIIRAVPYGVTAWKRVIPSSSLVIPSMCAGHWMMLLPTASLSCSMISATSGSATGASV